MKAEFSPKNSNKRYLTQNDYLRKRFGQKVIKISLNGGFTCPNKDGSKGIGGCTYCSDGSGDFAGNPCDDIPTQFKKVRESMEKKWSGLYIPYFQANTSTYAPLSKLKELYEAALSQENVVGLSIATRADCITEEIADYLKGLSNRTYLTVELGLQTIHDETAKRINRCHSYEDFLAGFKLLSERGILTCIHIINGLPGETHEMMLQTTRELSSLDIHSIKLHLLHVIKGTPLAAEYERGEFNLLSLEEYVDIICDQLEVLPPEVIIQRVTGDGNPETLIGPMWSRKKFVVLNEIDKELRRRDSWQGKLYKG